MEDNLELDSNKVEHIFLHEIFEKVCPYYLSIGMTYEQFWYGDATMTIAYRKADEMKSKQKAIEDKWARWEQGLYIYEALCDVSPILRAFSKITKPLPFTEKPYDIEKYYEDVENEERKKIREEKEKELETYKAEIFFKNWFSATKERFKGKKGG